MRVGQTHDAGACLRAERWRALSKARINHHEPSAPVARRGGWAVGLGLLICGVIFSGAASADPIVLQGTVTDRASGLPLVNAAVILIRRNAPVTVTDTNGNYSLTAAQIGNASAGTLYFQATGHYVASADFAIATTPLILNATLMAAGPVIGGTVKDANTQAGVAGAFVNFRFACDAGQYDQCTLTPFDTSTYTGADGRYSIDSSQLLESGAAGLRIAYDTLSAATYYTQTDSDLAVPITDPPPGDWDFVLEAGSGVSFEDVAWASGIDFTGRSFGVSWGDFNGDGWPDVYTGNHKTLGSLYVNNGDGTFTNIFPAQWTNPSTPDKHGTAWGDFDNDGDQDIMEVSGAGEGTGASPNVFMVANNGTVTDEAAQRGVDYPLGRGRTPLWLDWNNDGLLDLFISNLSRPDGQAPSALFLQANGNFYPHKLSGLPPTTNGLFAQSSELMGDGRRMLIIHGSVVYPEEVFAFGVEPAVDLRTALKIPLTTYVRDVAIEDFNGDLLPDFFLARLDPSASDSIQTDSRTVKTSFNVTAVDRGVTFVCACNLTFTLGPSWEINASKVFIGAAGTHPKFLNFTLSASSSAVAGLYPHTPGNGSGLYVGYDKVTKTWTLIGSKSTRLAFNVQVISSADISNLVQVNLNPSNLAKTNRLLLNTGKGFADASNQPALATPTACESVAAGDFDNDMDVDIYLVCRGQVQNLPNILLENDGTGHFRVVPQAAGAEGSSDGRGDSASSADYDNDGFLDLFVTNGNGEVPFTNGPYQLFHNIGNGNHWLELRLQGVQSSRDGVGAKVIVTAGGKKQMREQNGGVHRIAQNDQRLHFGLAGNPVASSVTVYWPSGVVQTLYDVMADQILQVREAATP